MEISEVEYAMEGHVDVQHSPQSQNNNWGVETENCLLKMMVGENKKTAT